MDFKKLGIIFVFITFGLIGIEYLSYALHSITYSPGTSGADEEDNRLLYLALLTAAIGFGSMIAAYLQDDPSNTNS